VGVQCDTVPGPTGKRGGRGFSESTYVGSETCMAYRLRRDIGLDFAYWYDRYEVDDFALGEGALNRIV